MSLQPINIFGYDQGGLKTNKKPLYIPDQAFQFLENAYAFRDRVKLREGLKFLGRLQRVLTSQSLGLTVGGPATIDFPNIFTTLLITGENPEINPGTLVITVGAPDTASFTDNGDGTFTVTGSGVAAGSFVNYATGHVVLNFTVLIGGAAITANLGYFPSLPTMGIPSREIAALNDEQTILFDTKYAYIWTGTEFNEFIPGTTWAGTDSDFFWSTNYRGIEPQDRLFFTTNFVNDAADPIRYTDGITWTDFSPVLSATQAQNIAIGTISGNGTTFVATLPNPPIIPSSVTITVAGITFTDPTGSGTLTGTGLNSGTINYTSGAIVLNFNPTINFSGAITNITTAVNAQVTSANHHLTTGAEITITGVTGTIDVEVNDKNFTITFVDANNFLLNATTTGVYTSGGSWTLTLASQTVNASFETGTQFLFQARVLIPYFGRLLALNVWEGNTIASSSNIFNRCRFSQVGSPIDSNAWRSDIFGRGGFLDAPTNEAIVSATFLNNTLIVFFERTTWQLRYVGEYGLPFIWERIASDLGSESTFSSVLFNQNLLAIGDKAIIGADSNSVQRIDLDIPDQIFAFQNANNGVKRVQGIRDYQKELVYWCYADSRSQSTPGTAITYPNSVLIFNYRNNTWSIFRDNVTEFGTIQLSSDVTWDSQTVFWDSEIVTWDDTDTQSRFPLIISGNQEGFINFYQIQGSQGTPLVNLNEQPSLSVTGVSFPSNILTLTVLNHNLSTGECIYLSNLQFIDSTTFLPVPTDLNNKIYKVTVPPSSPNSLQLSRWDFVLEEYFDNFNFLPVIANSIYVGGGHITLLPVLNAQTKDFNPFQTKGLQSKLSYLDFLVDNAPNPKSGNIIGATAADPCVIHSLDHGLIDGQKVTISQVQGMVQLNTSQYFNITVINADRFSIPVDSTFFDVYTIGGVWTLLTSGMAVQLFLNSSPSISGNLLVGNKAVSTFNTPPFYGPGSDYSWHRFYSTCTGQYFNVLMTFDDNMKNSIETYQMEWSLNGMTCWVRPGGKVIF